MTIKQQGGIFGRNPTFNDANVDNDLTVSGSLGVGTTSPTRTAEIVSSNNVPMRVVSTASISQIRLVASGTTTGATEPAIGAQGDALLLRTNGSTAVTITAAQNIKVNSGNGIDFSATSGTGTSELFSDYEQGSWSPVAARFTGGAISATYNTQAGYYTKVGNLVTCSLWIDIASISSQGSSLTYIGGLPYAPARSYYDVGTTGNNTAFTTVDVVSMLAHTDSRLYFREAGNTSSNSSAAWAAGALSGTITYMTS